MYLANEHVIKEEFVREIEKRLPAELASQLIPLLDDRDAVGQLATKLPSLIRPDQLIPYEPFHRAWELFGRFFQTLRRPYDALTVFNLLYDHMLVYQDSTGTRIHKGNPL